MALTIFHNLLAQSVARDLGKHQDNLSRVVRSLSSGLRISSASDDPAGLSISEIGKAKSRSLAQASRNLQDGLSLITTATGHLNVVDTMLTRVTELAEQAATGTYTTQQRALIQNEASLLISEIERGGKAANFNGIKLFATDSSLQIQAGITASDAHLLNLAQTTATSLGGTLAGGQMAYQRLNIDGGSAGTAKTGATLAASIQSSFFGNQTITVRNAGDARTVTINSTQGNNSTKDILAALENLGMDGMHSAGSLTTADFSSFTKSGLGGSEGDLAQFDVDIAHGTGSSTATVSFLIGVDDATTLANVGAALQRIVSTVNTANGDTDLITTGSILQSQAGNRISVGNLTFADAAGVRIRDILGASDPQDSVTLSVAGITITTANASHAAAMDSISTQLVAGLSAAGKLYDPNQFLNSTSYASPAASAGSYIVRRDYNDDSIVVTRIASSQAAPQDIQVTLTGGNQTQAVASGFGATAGREVYLSVDGTQVHYTSAGGGSAQNLASAIASAGIANITATTNGAQTVIRKTSQPALPIAISGYYENRTAVLSGFSGPQGEHVSFSLNGANIAFNTGASLASNAQLMYNAIQAAGLGNLSASLNLGAGSITLSNTVNAAITLAGYNDGGNNNTSLIVSAQNGATGSQTLTATGATGTTVDNPSSSSLQIAAGSGSSGGGTLATGNSFTITKNAAQLVLGGVEGQSAFSSGTTLDSSTNTTTTASRVSGGARSAGLASIHGAAAQITSGQSNWATVNGVGYILLDANTSFEAYSNQDGTAASTGKGAFFKAANAAASTDYVTQSIKSSADISDFTNTAGDTVSFSIQGVGISFQAHGSAHQASNANALYNALLASTTQLTAAGVSFALSQNEKSVTLTKNSGNLSITGYHDNNAAFASGLKVQGVNEVRPITLTEGKVVDAVLTPYASIAQIDLLTQTGAADALSILHKALTANAATQASLGAQSNVLSGMDTFAQIDRENTDVMVSRITDVDIATAMTEYTRQTILMKASQAMLAQANILPKQLLRLLQNGIML